MFRFLTAMLLLIAPSFVLACQCAPREGLRNEQVQQEFAQSTAVFSGHVESIHYAKLNGVRTRMAELRVLQVWKGKLKPDTSIRVVSDGENGPMYCGYIAKPGMSLMVYARGQGVYTLNTCSLTGSMKLAEEDIPILNALMAGPSGASR